MALMKRCFFIPAILLAGSLACPAQEFSSGPKQVSLIELYTSEGCSSCPPADRKLNALADNDGLWKEFVPVAFHVDYWDDLGWPDPFSSSSYSARQRRYTKEWHAGTSYTPCFVVNGAPARKPVSTGRIEQSGILKVRLNGNQAIIAFTPTNPKVDYIAWIAPLSGMVRSQVKAGENRGRKLDHCFVALGLAQAKMDTDGRTRAATLTVPADNRTQAIAVWVSSTDSLIPLQATGGWVKPQ